MGNVGFKATDISDAVRDAFAAARIVTNPSILAEIQKTATDTMKEAGALLKKEGRASIRGAGFSSKWANAWRVTTYPTSGASINAAVYGYHKIPYSMIFETGGTIRAKSGLLWLPLPTLPKIGRSGRPSPRELANRGVKLVSMKRKNGKPLLGASLRLTAAEYKRATGTVRGRKGASGKIALSLSKLRRGSAATKGLRTTIPLYVGVEQVRMPALLKLTDTALSVQSRLGAIFAKNYKG